jgi:hypothetical protein
MNLFDYFNFKIFLIFLCFMKKNSINVNIIKEMIFNYLITKNFY